MEDIRWFMLILSIVLLAFSQAFLAILAGLNPPSPCDEVLLDELNQNLTKAKNNNDTEETLSYMNTLLLYQDCEIGTHYKRSYEVGTLVLF